MRKTVITLLCGATLAFSQAAPPAAAVPAPPVDPNKVVASINGKKYTARELEDISKGLPGQFQQFYNQDREGFLKQLAVLNKLSDLALAAKVETQTPFKQRIEFMRLQILAQGFVEDYRAKLTATDEEVAKFYETSKDGFTQAKLQVILVNYAVAPKEGEKKTKLTEAEAGAKAADLVKQIKAGGDFKKFVELHSDDVASKAKGGDFGTIRKSDQIPPELSRAIFALKAGEVSEPVKQPNGFYIFRVVEYTAQPLEEVKPQLTTQLKEQKLQEWLRVTQDSAAVEILDPAFAGKPMTPPMAPPAASPAATPKPATPKTPAKP